MNLLFPNLSQHIKVLEKDAPLLLKNWMKSPEVGTVLQQHAMNTDFFGNYFGSKVIEYAFGVIKGNNELGNCPVIGIMLTIYKRKNIPISDVFLIYTHFKNTLIRYA